MIDDTATSTLTAPLTTAALAALLSYHPESVRRAIRQGRIRALPYGRTWRVPADEVARILREGLPSLDREEVA
jgi:excisionase family DNA binding protein